MFRSRFGINHQPTAKTARNLLGWIVQADRDLDRRALGVDDWRNGFDYRLERTRAVHRR